MIILMITTIILLAAERRQFCAESTAESTAILEVKKPDGHRCTRHVSRYTQCRGMISYCGPDNWLCLEAMTEIHRAEPKAVDIERIVR